MAHHDYHFILHLVVYYLFLFPFFSSRGILFNFEIVLLIINCHFQTNKDRCVSINKNNPPAASFSLSSSSSPSFSIFIFSTTSSLSSSSSPSPFSSFSSLFSSSLMTSLSLSLVSAFSMSAFSLLLSLLLLLLTPSSLPSPPTSLTRGRSSPLKLFSSNAHHNLVRKSVENFWVLRKAK